MESKFCLQKSENAVLQNEMVTCHSNIELTIVGVFTPPSTVSDNNGIHCDHTMCN